MQIIRRHELVDQPWKNGGGITREIAADRRDGKLVWRLSMADVASDGPFSRFDGLMRILTVVEGNGMALISPQETLQADYGQPVRFPGDWEISSKLKDGALTDLNLIFDPARCEAAASTKLGVRGVAVAGTVGKLTILHILKGKVSLQTGVVMAKGDTALLPSEALQASAQTDVDAVVLTLTLKAN